MAKAGVDDAARFVSWKHDGGMFVPLRMVSWTVRSSPWVVKTVGGHVRQSVEAYA
jgi:hypothetical protein